MKKIYEEGEEPELESLIGENVLLICEGYIYHGKLTNVTDAVVTLENPKIVYETGEWAASSYKDAQSLPVSKWHVRLKSIESFGKGL
jgi:hypothetical protein